MRGGVSQVFATLNRGKKSIALDLKSESDRGLFLDMVKNADVVVESFRPGVMERLGCGSKTLLELNPSLVILSISGYGQEGPLALRAGHDLNFLARSGLLHLNRNLDGQPVVPGFQSADIAGGALLPLAQLLAAMLHRERTGEGAHLDASMMDGVVSLGALPLAEVMGESPDYDPAEAVLAGKRACYRIYETADGRFMALAALEPKFWQGFCAIVERPDWLSRHLTTGDEGQQLCDEVAALFARESQGHWIDVFAPHDVCCEPVLTPREALDTPFRGLSRTHEAGEDGPIMLRTPFQVESWSDTDLSVPELGGDRAEVLALFQVEEQG